MTKKTTTKALPQYTRAEVEKHNKTNDAWVIVEEEVFDVTDFIPRHPGGHKPLESIAGYDATDAFQIYHPPGMWKRLQGFKVGVIVEADKENCALATDFRALNLRLYKDGLYDNNISWFTMKFGIVVAILAMAIKLSLGGSVVDEAGAVVGWTWGQMGGALLIALFWQQAAFLAHDVGHTGVTGKFKTDYLLGLMAPLAGGISMGWWKKSHNVHHIVCNSVEYDPDIQHAPVLAVTAKYLSEIYSHYHNKVMVFGRIGRWFVTKQHYLFYPIMGVARFNLYVQSYLHLFSSPAEPKFNRMYRHAERVCMLIFAAWYISLTLRVQAGWPRFFWVVLCHVPAGILHVQIILSHFSMETHDGPVSKNHGSSFFRMQLYTTLGVTCPEWFDWFHGGLQFQIEHHLFPRLPRHNLRRVRTMVKELAAKHGVDYVEDDFFGSNGRIYDHLKSAANVAKHLPPGVTPDMHMIKDAMNAFG